MAAITLATKAPVLKPTTGKPGRMPTRARVVASNIAHGRLLPYVNHLQFPAESSPDQFFRTQDGDGALPHGQPGMQFGGGDASLYVQRDRTLDGYNANEEHALLMSIPSQ